jgi:hypothetical protein
MPSQKAPAGIQHIKSAAAAAAKQQQSMRVVALWEVLGP